VPGPPLQTTPASPRGELMRIIVVALVVVLAACSSHPTVSSRQTATPIVSGTTITVRLSNFAFDPENLRFKAGEPVRLRLVNDSGGDHDFAAPGFFGVKQRSARLAGSVGRRNRSWHPSDG
jgi:uncharacterized cupredoxin-like copper-binding protein